MHELDHINGRTMTHWRLSEGNVDVLSGHEKSYPNLMTTVDFYKQRVSEAKSQFEESLNRDDRKYKEVVSDDGSTWKEFTPETREDIYKIKGLSNDSKPTFEDTMIIDTIKAMRRDRR